MKIKQLELFAVHFPLHEPFVVSYDSYPVMPSIIAKLTTDCGLIGWGEAVPDEHVTGETFESTFAVLEHLLAPKMIGQNPMQFEQIHSLMDKLIKHAPTAKAAIDIACYDVAGKKLGVPVYQLIGGKVHEKFRITHVLSIDEPEKMAKVAKVKVQEGYNSFKMKVGRDVASDVERIKVVRQAVGKDVAIRVDVNQGWKNSANTLVALKMLEPLHIDWVEQPVVSNDIDALAEVKMKTTIPIMIDEGLCNARDMREVIQKRAADKANIKLMKAGGIYPAIKLCAMAEMAGIECQIGSMLESSIGSAAGFHVAFSKSIVTSVELTGPLKFEKDIGNLKESFSIPFIELSERPGLGVQIDEKQLSELTRKKVVVFQ